jgi:hypothetical protein
VGSGEPLQKKTSRERPFLTVSGKTIFLCGPDIGQPAALCVYVCVDGDSTDRYVGVIIDVNGGRAGTRTPNVLRVKKKDLFQKRYQFYHAVLVFIQLKGGFCHANSFADCASLLGANPVCWSICIIHHLPSRVFCVRRRVPQATSSNRLLYEEGQGRSPCEPVSRQ